MTILSCQVVEDLLLAGTVDAAVVEHLAGCESCRELQEGLVALSGLRAPEPAASLLALARAGAAAELRLLRAARRRALLAAAGKVLLGFVLALPLVLLIHAALASAFESTVGALLPATALLGAEIAGFVLSLLSLSAVAFLLTLAAGAAAHPPRPSET